MILLYALARDPFPMPDTTGVDGQSLFTICLDGVAVVAEERDHAPGADTETALAFGRAVESLASLATVLPVRFGTSVEGREEVVRLLEEHGRQWLTRLERVDGHVELAVRARDTEPAPEGENPPDDSTGTGYLMTRVRRSRRVEALRTRILEQVGPDCAEARTLADRDGISLALLVRREVADGVRHRLLTWASDEPAAGLELSCTGPWPPYSFGEEDAAS